MATKKHTAVDALGGIHKRNSASGRVYSHTVVVLNTYEGAVAHAHARHADWIKTHKSNFQYYTDIAEGRDPHPEHDWVGGVKVPNAEKQAVRVAKHAAIVAAGFEAYHNGYLTRSLESIEEAKAKGAYETNGKPGRYQSVGWCGRLDLAHKLQAQYPGSTILTAEVKG